MGALAAWRRAWAGRRANRRSLRAERKADGRTGRDIQPDRAARQAYTGYFNNNAPPR